VTIADPESRFPNPDSSASIKTGPMWILRTDETAEQPARVFRLLPGSVRTIGRDPFADFIVDGPMISRVHCRVMVNAAGVLEAEDLDSTNGTFVNDRRITRAVLVTGDRLRLGRVEISVSRAEAAAV
jgi:pSer/pThr/pTyr-binding forkhead associated (FHA) protein